MRLADLVAEYPTARLAMPADNTRILEFFERSPMRTSAFAVQYRRRPDFFRLLRYQSDRAFVIISEDTDGAVRSVGTVSLRPGWMHGRPTTIGYLGDLRIAYDRRLVRAWRRLFADLLARARDIEELADCTHWFTAVLDENRAALTALRSRSGERGQPALVPIGPFTMRNLIARLPMAGRSRGRGPWHVREARAEDREALTRFFEEENRHVPLGFRGELARRMACWDGLAIEGFVVAEDEHGPVACVAPWSPSAAKQTIVSSLPVSLRWLGRLARVLPSQPLRVPERGEVLRSLYLTNLTFTARLSDEDRARVFRRMLDHLFDRWGGADWHSVALCDFRAWNLGRALGGYLQETVPITVYQVVAPGHQPQEADGARAAGPPAFEMALV
jgi:hypothetical protein